MYAYFGKVELVHEGEGRSYRLLDFDNRLNPRDSVHRDLSAVGADETPHLLLGYAVDEAGRALVFNSDGLAAWTKATGGTPESLATGSFLAFSVGTDTIRLWTDDAANIPLFYYVSDELFLFSDSLSEISRYLRHRIDVGICREALIARGVGSNIGNQLVSGRTPIDGVRMLLRDRVLEVRMDGATARDSLRRKRPPAQIEPSPAAVAEIGNSIALHAGAFADDEGHRDFRFFLSGGVDSRVVLGALRFAGIDMRSVNVRSNVHPSRSVDLVVVEQLAARFGFEVNPRRGKRIELFERSDRQAFAAWQACNLGVYDMLYLHHRVARNPFDQIVLTGNGGGIGRAVYGRRAPDAFLQKIAPPHREPLRAEFEHAAEAFGCAPDDPQFLDLHYLNFRNSLHAGRSFYSVGCKVVPLSSPPLMSLVDRLPVEWKDSNVLHALLLCYYDPELLEIPFDRDREPFAPDGIEQARAFLRGAVLDRDVDVGSLRVFGERRLRSPLLEADGIESDPGETILDVIEGRLEACRHSLHSYGVYEYFAASFEAIEAARTDNGGYLPETGIHFAKVSMIADLLEPDGSPPGPTLSSRPRR